MVSDNLMNIKWQKWFADPFIQNIYYEVDYMGKSGLFDPPHYFFEETKQGMIERFAEHNIKLLFDDGWPDSPKNGGGQDTTTHRENIPRLRDDVTVLRIIISLMNEKVMFRYFVIGHGGGFQHPSKNNVYDTTQISYISARFKPLKNAFNFLLGGAVPTERGKRVQLGSSHHYMKWHIAAASMRIIVILGVSITSAWGPISFPIKIM